MHDTEEILNYLIPEENRDYKCYDLLKETINKYPEFKEILIAGVESGNILKMNTDFLECIFALNTNAYHISSFFDYFTKGNNIGGCQTLVDVMAMLLPNANIIHGYNKFLVDTKNSKEGEHFWVEDDNMIYDTSFMMIIDKSYLSKLGYSELERTVARESSRFIDIEKRTNDKTFKGVK